MVLAISTSSGVPTARRASGGRARAVTVELSVGESAADSGTGRPRQARRAEAESRGDRVTAGQGEVDDVEEHGESGPELFAANRRGAGGLDVGHEEQARPDGQRRPRRQDRTDMGAGNLEDPADSGDGDQPDEPGADLGADVTAEGAVQHGEIGGHPVRMP